MIEKNVNEIIRDLRAVKDEKALINSLLAAYDERSKDNETLLLLTLLLEASSCSLRGFFSEAVCASTMMTDKEKKRLVSEFPRKSMKRLRTIKDDSDFLKYYFPKSSKYISETSSTNATMFIIAKAISIMISKASDSLTPGLVSRLYICSAKLLKAECQDAELKYITSLLDIYDIGKLGVDKRNLQEYEYELMTEPLNDEPESFADDLDEALDDTTILTEEGAISAARENTQDEASIMNILIGSVRRKAGEDVILFEEDAIIQKTINSLHVSAGIVLRINGTVVVKNAAGAHMVNGTIYSGEQGNMRLIVHTPTNMIVAALSEDEYTVFQRGTSSILGLLAAFYDYLKAFPKREQREELRKSLTETPDDSKYDCTPITGFTRNQFKSVFAFKATKYAPDTQRAIRHLLHEEKMDKKTERKLDYLLNISPTNQGRKIITEEELRSCFSSIYGYDEVKEMLIDTFLTFQNEKTRGFSVLVVGPSGTGKSLLGHVLAEAGGLSCTEISVPSLNSPLELTGTDSTYSDSAPGKLAESCRELLTSEQVFLFKQLDCTKITKEGNIIDGLYTLLDDSERSINDSFLEGKIQCPNSVIYATANSTDNIPPGMLSMFDLVLRCKAYSLEDKMKIGAGYIIPKLQKALNANISFTSAALRHIIINYCSDSGCHDLEHNLKIVMRRVLRCKGQKKYSISKKDVMAILKPLIDEKRPGIRLNQNIDDYTEQTANLIRDLIYKEENLYGVQAQEKLLIKEKIEYALSTRILPAPVEVNTRTIREELSKTHYGMTHLINELTGYLALGNRSRQISCKVVLTGAPGTGKTTIIQSLADVLDYKLVKVSLSSTSSVSELRGTSIEPGKILRCLKATQDDRKGLIILLDEIDKSEYRSLQFLIELLDDNGFVSPYLDGIKIHLNNCLFFSTANEYATVPTPIQSRFQMVAIPGYDRQGKERVLNDYIIPKLQKEFGIKILLDEKAQQLLLDNNSEDGLRSLNREVIKLIGMKIDQLDSSSKALRIRIGAEDVKTLLLGANNTSVRKCGF